jgi:hypothetical protein
MRSSAALALSAFIVALTPPSPAAADTAIKNQRKNWPVTVEARYGLHWEGLKVGWLNTKSSFTADSYNITGHVKVRVLFGKFKWWGSANVSGVLASGIPQLATYSLAWHQKRKKKDVFIRMGFKDRIATDIAVTPPPKVRSDTVPLLPIHKADAFDPLSAVLMLTKADENPPCKRRVGIFDGKQRYDIVLTPKRLKRLPSRSGKGAREIAYVCRITYEPVAGHRANADTKSFAANRKAEIVIRRVPGTAMLIPYSVTIPTAWGTASMVTDRIKVVTGAAKYVFKQ